jgi:hypothetical protein
MAFMRTEGSLSPNRPSQDSFTLTISEFKFTPKRSRLVSDKAVPVLVTEPSPESIMARQIPKRGLSFKSDR